MDGRADEDEGENPELYIYQFMTMAQSLRQRHECVSPAYSRFEYTGMPKPMGRNTQPKRCEPTLLR